MHVETDTLWQGLSNTPEATDGNGTESWTEWRSSDSHSLPLTTTTHIPHTSDRWDSASYLSEK